MSLEAEVAELRRRVEQLEEWRRLQEIRRRGERAMANRFTEPEPVA
jgi:hypothetical protein